MTLSDLEYIFTNFKKWKTDMSSVYISDVNIKTREQSVFLISELCYISRISLYVNVTQDDCFVNSEPMNGPTGNRIGGKCHVFATISA